MIIEGKRRRLLVGVEWWTTTKTRVVVVIHDGYKIKSCWSYIVQAIYGKVGVVVALRRGNLLRTQRTARSNTQGTQHT